MPHPIDYKLLLNRQAYDLLHQVELASLTEGLRDINDARKLALWRRCSGADIYLLSLLLAASRLTALRYFEQILLQPELYSISLAGSSHPLPELASSYRVFLDCYPRRDLARACNPGMAQGEKQARQRLLAELFVLETLVDNPATLSFLDLFDDKELENRLDYRALINRVAALSIESGGRLMQGRPLPELLRAPMRAAPHSLVGQVQYIVQNWAAWLPEEILNALQLARAISEEESLPRLPGPGPSIDPLFSKGDVIDAPAAFTADIDWMASCVLLAKSIYVWLDQLSSHYQRRISTLAEIPDQELASLAGQGFNALWLIGIWERSVASRTIKQLCGNPDAEASAYALHAYRVAADLGGERALQDLEQRCHRHGIRLACDVVPNHTGIDSEWLKEHPDWFLQTESPPYPAYRFTGPDLCAADDISIRIEDGYWDHSDAAVVCEHHDHASGRRRYIYHGNDGTHMPWNDTAQLNFLLPEVRQAMSDLIVEIARRFSLIRFDAAMTLARKHFRRLWFPPPGGSAGVPSRSAFWMSDSDFDRAFPVEFWREVVDRINLEVPDTLLIAEAFWLMESYFVRNLGMHRVYNSAFMNMLKREENAKYRKILKDILAYNPEILKRYVNFMNNPDEATAVEQFDKGDKYFGVATLLATLPGLPMFGHGQVEGYREKYGMEYRRAYWDEKPDAGFVAHHERQIFPLLRIRHQFAGVDHFSLYDFVSAHGIDDNVYAYSNGPAGNKTLVVYNNSVQPTQGSLHQAAPKASPQHEGVAKPMPPLWRELGLDPDRGAYCRFRNLAGAEFLRKVDDISQGFALQLGGYEHLVFHSFQMLDDADGSWEKLARRLQGRPVDNLDRELLQERYQPLWEIFTRLIEPGRLQALAGGLRTPPLTAPVKALIAQLCEELNRFATALAAEQGGKIILSSAGALDQQLQTLASWLGSLTTSRLPDRLLVEAWFGTRRLTGLGIATLSWLLLHNLGKLLDCADDSSTLEYLNGYGLDYAWQESVASTQQGRDVLLARLLMRTSSLSSHPASCEAPFAELCREPANAGLLGINVHAGSTWFVQEGMTALAGAIALQAALLQLQGSAASARVEPVNPAVAETLRQRLARAAAVGYRLDKFLSLG